MRQPDLTVSRAAHGQSEEVTASVGDTIAELCAARERAQADAAVLRELFWVMGHNGKPRWCVHCRHNEPAHYLGCPLIIFDAGEALLVELAAARAVFEAARTHDNGNIDDALFAYDAAVEARTR